MSKLLYIPLVALILALAACGDEHLVDKDPITLKQYVFVGPDGFSGDIANYYDPIEKFYAEQGQTIKFFAGYSAGGSIYTDESLQQYYNGLLWEIDSSTYNLNYFRHTFLNPGEFEGSLKTVDLFGDTLHTAFKIYVNTPNEITLEAPINGYNQASPESDQELKLRWKVSGIDPWEKPHCIIYMSYKRDSVWNMPLGITNCNEPATLKGSLIQTYDSIAQQDISPYDSSFTLYWGAKLVVKSESGREYRDSTDIFHFSTKILEETSTLKIPFLYERYRDISILQTKAYLISKDGDTLQTLTNDLPVGTLSTKIKPQFGLKVILEEKYRKEYARESLEVDIPAYTVLTTDTVVFKDSTPPQLAPANNQVINSDSIAFHIYDDGSGINISRLQVIMDFDTLDYNYSVPTVKFFKNCFSKCKLSFVGEDNAHNSLPNVYWTIEAAPGYRLISGPYSYEGF